VNSGSGINVEQWLDILEKSQQFHDEGLSSKEIATKLGMTVPQVLIRVLQPLHERGVLIAGRRQITRVDGSPGYMPVYRIKTNAQTAKDRVGQDRRAAVDHRAGGKTPGRPAGRVRRRTKNDPGRPSIDD
jgi:hypothetical protein